MSETFCKYAWDHEPGEACQHCNLEVDRHGNTEEDFLNCSYPDCGCDGNRLCMAPNGPNLASQVMNIEKHRRKSK